jgi:hypothetical protein
MSIIVAIATIAITNQCDAEYSRRNIMAKGQQHKNKEAKKPKQDKKVVVVTGSGITSKLNNSSKLNAPGK